MLPETLRSAAPIRAMSSAPIPTGRRSRGRQDFFPEQLHRAWQSVAILQSSRVLIRRRHRPEAGPLTRVRHQTQSATWQ